MFKGEHLMHVAIQENGSASNYSHKHDGGMYPSYYYFLDLNIYCKSLKYSGNNKIAMTVLCPYALL